jgi:hypothetical protein
MNCYICGDKYGLHTHHIIPRAYGGTNGPTVTLCGGCHTLIHSIAVHKNKEERNRMMQGHSERQKIKIIELVDIIRRARISSRQFKRPMTLQLILDAETATMLRQLKRMLGAKSLSQALFRCIRSSYDKNSRR